MNIMMRNLNQILAIKFNRTSRNFCFTATPLKIPPVRKSVIVSTSNDIYTNLALERWIYKNPDLLKDHLLMLWVNDPCIVIGRHQNPWAEANVFRLKELGVQLARRDSGGGTVYHDQGNLNLTFFTPKNHYCRKYNLEFMVETLRKDFGMKLDVTPKDDILLREFKVSGTAAKLSGTYAYHHCTLLIKAHKDTLKKSLKPIDWDIKTNATKSTRSKTVNLADEDSNLKIEDLIRAMGIRYLRENNANLSEVFGSVSEINKGFLLDNPRYISKGINMKSIKLQLITPSEENFPGITEMRNEFVGWQWIYGRTPVFKLSKGFKIEVKTHTHTSNPHEVQRIIYTQSRTYVVLVKISVEEGIITQVNVQMPSNCSGDDINHKLERAQVIRGTKFSGDALQYVERIFIDDTHEQYKVEEAALNK